MIPADTIARARDADIVAAAGAWRELNACRERAGWSLPTCGIGHIRFAVTPESGFGAAAAAAGEAATLFRSSSMSARLASGTLSAIPARGSGIGGEIPRPVTPAADDDLAHASARRSRSGTRPSIRAERSAKRYLSRARAQSRRRSRGRVLRWHQRVRAMVALFRNIATRHR